jgi:hypothetical protein
MSIKDKFIRDLIDELNDVNERQLIYNNKTPIDVCYIVSVIDQQIENCEEFINDILKNKYYINGYDEDTSGGYTNGRIRVLVEKPDEEKESEYMMDAYYDYCYYIDFLLDERYWGYCECSPKDEDYNEQHKCCGNGCDWVAPAFSVTKSIGLVSGKWNGQERDYWEYEEKFKANEQNKNAEVEKYEKEENRKRIENQIKDLQEKLKEFN